MKVISFSLWGSDPKYNIGAIENAKLARKIYPDWTCRFYVGRSVPEETLGKLTSEENGLGDWTLYEQIDREFYLVDTEGKSRVPSVEIYSLDQEGDWRGMFWRFWAACDPKVDVMISRDCDSRLSIREKACVDAWLASDKNFHTIHDHYHHSVPILGGLWGAKRGFISNFSELIASWKQEDRWQTDQDFLTQTIWPLVQHDVLNHADFHTNIWPGVPIPMVREEGVFIGAGYDENNEINKEQLKSLNG